MKEIYLVESATHKYPDVWQIVCAWDDYNAAKDSAKVLWEIQPHLKHRVTVVDLYERKSCKTK